MSMIQTLEYISEQSLDELRLKLFRFGRASVDASWRGGVLSSAFSRLYYVKQGSFYLMTSSGRIDFTEGNWYLVPPSVAYTYGCDRECEHLFLHFTMSCAYQNECFSECREVLTLESGAGFAKRLEETAGKADAVSEFSRRITITELILRLVEKYGVRIAPIKYSSCVTKAIEYINANLSEALTISGIASAIFVSASTLTKSFRRELSVSVNQYVDNLVLEKAARLIIEDKLSLGAISQGLGFCDQFYFSRKFKRRFGVPPSKCKRAWNI